MPVCSEPRCVSLATRGDKCAVHGAGYRQAAADDELRCARCTRRFRVGAWYRIVAGELLHIGPCPAAGPDHSSTNASPRS